MFMFFFRFVLYILFYFHLSLSCFLLMYFSFSKVLQSKLSSEYYLCIKIVWGIPLQVTSSCFSVLSSILGLVARFGPFLSDRWPRGYKWGRFIETPRKYIKIIPLGPVLRPDTVESISRTRMVKNSVHSVQEVHEMKAQWERGILSICLQSSSLVSKS
jgi:hypothetical protein